MIHFYKSYSSSCSLFEKLIRVRVRVRIRNIEHEDDILFSLASSVAAQLIPPTGLSGLSLLQVVICHLLIGPCTSAVETLLTRPQIASAENTSSIDRSNKTEILGSNSASPCQNK